jgi:hypothetical protein
VSEAVSLSVSESTGVSEGVSLGVSEGVSLGVSEGVSLGVSEGVSLGVSEGVSLGVSEGVSLGVSEGVSMLVSVSETVSSVSESGLVSTVSFSTSVSPPLLHAANDIIPTSAHATCIRITTSSRASPLAPENPIFIPVARQTPPHSRR